MALQGDNWYWLHCECQCVSRTPFPRVALLWQVRTDREKPDLWAVEGAADLLPPRGAAAAGFSRRSAVGRGQTEGRRGPATSDVMEGVKQEVMVVNRLQAGRRAGPATGRRCVSVLDPKLARNGC